jgi:uridine phosphorylase
MFAIELEGIACGMIARTIGGAYAVLIAEQLQAAGAKIIIGLTSAGRVTPDLPLPCLIVAASAIRDEGTSYHYLPPGSEITCPTPIVPILERELIATGWTVRAGKVWTTDAPYRETRVQLEKWAGEGALAVEMQAASLFAFGAARRAAVASVAMVSNAVDHEGEQFDTGSKDDGLRILKGIARAAKFFLASP